MAQYVQQLVTVGDNYTEFPCPGTEYVNVQVFNAGVDIQYGRGFPAPIYGPFPEFLALTGFAGNRACDTIRFKNHVAGTPALIQITAQSKDNLPLGIPLGDSFTPNFMTINPDGTIAAQFSGGVVLNELPPSGSIGPANALSWQDTGGVTRELVFGAADAGGDHSLELESTADVNNTARLFVTSRQAGVLGQSSVSLSLTDGSHAAPSATIYDSATRSQFLQGGAIGGSAFAQPSNGFGLGRVPNTLRPTLVLMSFLLSTAGGGTFDAVSVIVNGVLVAEVYYRDFGVVPGGIADQEVTVFCFVPAGQQYFANIANSAGNAGYPHFSLTSEWTL